MIDCPECHKIMDDDEIETERRPTGFGDAEVTHYCTCGDCGCVFSATEETTYSFLVEEHGSAWDEKEFLKMLGRDVENE